MAILAKVKTKDYEYHSFTTDTECSCDQACSR